ncbi:hypothetical protein SAMN04487936_10413 [Halobacillus dabanensis]|uniref:Uncharacterized protein n=1 Tax=Halobacillus dabanensis TaxID=240302 RepID=A0A1I3TVA2_HALDA|nr:hypothetical protein SAMN04487936_10413 [Halobacillus dabanensis]
MEQNETTKGNGLALLPFGVFILLFIGSGILTGDFYQMPVLVAIFAAILIALFMNRKTDFQTKLRQLTEGGRTFKHHLDGHYLPFSRRFLHSG